MKLLFAVLLLIVASCGSKQPKEAQIRNHNNSDSAWLASLENILKDVHKDIEVLRTAK